MITINRINEKLERNKELVNKSVSKYDGNVTLNSAV